MEKSKTSKFGGELERVLIYSKEDDESTNKVLEWMEFLAPNVQVVRKSGFNLYESIAINKNKYDSIWLRTITPIISNSTNDNDQFVLDELNACYYAGIKASESSKILGTTDNVKVNKIEALKLAKDNGIDIPETLITTSKDELLEFYERHKKIIFKCISDPIIIKEGGKKKTLYTHLLKDSDLNLLPRSFFPTLFQKFIEKKYEIRSFFLDNKFYSMAIFSADNQKTQVDLRNYDFENPNRTVTYQLPSWLEENIASLMNSLNLNTGSIDLIKSTENKYYFLEINPIGQFGHVSQNCNYFLEKKVALYLLNV